jgi:hypothetical protein
MALVAEDRWTLAEVLRIGTLEGEPVVDVPKDFGLVLFYGDKMYGQWRDELDVQYLVVMEEAGLPPLERG